MEHMGNGRGFPFHLTVMVAAAWAVSSMVNVTPASAQSATAASWPDLSQPALAEGGGEADAALIIEIEDYAFVDDIPGALANADAWYVWFKRTRGVRLGNAVVLRNEQATREAILR